ncbi:MAG: hypothetical protein ACYC0H_15575 [Solirubrobacteraceae bacterium]
MNEQRLPDGIVGAEHRGTRVFCVSASDAQMLADRLAIVLGEHMADSDEMHLTYNAIQSGWEHDPGRPGWRERQPHTQLFFEYTALLVLRPAGDRES